MGQGRTAGWLTFLFLFLFWFSIGSNLAFVGLPTSNKSLIQGQIPLSVITSEIILYSNTGAFENYKEQIIYKTYYLLFVF